MGNREKYIELYSGNWLNNASILGFLISLEKIEETDVKEFMQKDGRVFIPRRTFKNLNVNGRYFESTKISSIVGKAPIYRNYLQPSEKDHYHEFIEALEELTGGQQCDILVRGYNIPENKVTELKSEAKGMNNFMERITDYNMVFHADLGPSMSAFPNAYWNLRNSNKVCHLFAFLVIHQHLSFTKLMDGTSIFINAPSFRLMYELNKLVSSFASKEQSSYRNLLAMSVIEFSIRSNIVLHTWAGMDIEIVAIKRNGEIEFISLPYDTIKLLSNKRVAELLSSIGEFRILNMVIDHKWNDLVELSYRLLKIAMNGIGKEDRDFLSRFYRSDNFRGEASIKLLANKLMQLYSLIEERTKKNNYAITV